MTVRYEGNFDVEVRPEQELGRRIYRIVVWANQQGSGLPGSFTNKRRAEKLARAVELNLKPEWEREQRELEARVAGS